jgi:hypothetical protein
MRILPGIGAAGEWNGRVHNSQALAGQGRGDRWERIRDCRFGIKVPDLAPLRTPPDELRKTLHPGLVAVKKQFLPFNSRTLVGHGSSGRPLPGHDLPQGCRTEHSREAADRVRLLGLFIAVVVIP